MYNPIFDRDATDWNSPPANIKHAPNLYIDLRILQGILKNIFFSLALTKNNGSGLKYMESFK